MFTQGYIGVSSNTEARFEQHSKSIQNRHLKFAGEKYGWDNLVKKVILIADKVYCLVIETKLRATKGIGWNSNRWRKSSTCLWQ
jgi:predicted GIY-YIG superfamily endonuclease